TTSGLVRNGPRMGRLRVLQRRDAPLHQTRLTRPALVRRNRSHRTTVRDRREQHRQQLQHRRRRSTHDRTTRPNRGDHILMNEEDERIEAWHEIAKHPFFEDAYNDETPLLDAMKLRLDRLMAQPTVVATQAEEPVEWRIY